MNGESISAYLLLIIYCLRAHLYHVTHLPCHSYPLSPWQLWPAGIDIKDQLSLGSLTTAVLCLDVKHFTSHDCIVCIKIIRRPRRECHWKNIQEINIVTIVNFSKIKMYFRYIRVWGTCVVLQGLIKYLGEERTVVLLIFFHLYCTCDE